jgi:TIR domain
MPVPIFVSYSHQDAGLVKPVVGLLRATKDLVFQDVDAIKPGSRWRPQIEEALGVAQLIVLFWCYHSSRSAEVRKEYELAVSTGKDVLPVLLDATPLPKELNEYQWVDFRQFVGLGHRFFKRWIAIAAAVSVLVVGFLAAVVLTPLRFEHKIEAPVENTIETPTVPPITEPPTEPLPLPEVTEPAPSPSRLSPWGLIIFPAIVLALVIWLMRRARRYRIRKRMAATLQEELLRRGISSV